jgi:hypothetical protein
MLGVGQPLGRHHLRAPTLAAADRRTLPDALADQVASHLGKCRLDLQKNAAGRVIAAEVIEAGTPAGPGGSRSAAAIIINALTIRDPERVHLPVKHLRLLSNWTLWHNRPTPSLFRPQPCSRCLDKSTALSAGALPSSHRIAEGGLDAARGCVPAAGVAKEGHFLWRAEGAADITIALMRRAILPFRIARVLLST